MRAVPRSSEVPRRENKGSVRKFHYSINKKCLEELIAYLPFTKMYFIQQAE
jgi:hypothetical protein